MEKTLPEIIESVLDPALEKAAIRSADPVKTMSREKHEDALCAHYVWNNGEQSVFLCPNAAERGTVFTSLEEALKTHPELGEKIAELEGSDKDDPFAQKLCPLSESEVVLYIPQKMSQKREFLVDVELSDADRAALCKVFVIIDDEASAVVTLNLHSRGANTENLFAGLFYCSVGSHAHLVLNEVQDLGLKTVCVRRKKTIVKESGDFHWNVCELGCAETCDSLDVEMKGKDSSAIVYGLYFPAGEQKMRMLTRQDHMVPHTYSNLHYKGALTDNASARWEGMVYVDPEAGQADGYQKNETLMLSDTAKIFAKPGLEIITDDVKCSHGTTITNIDDDQIFYLTSRGIPEREAEKLVIRGFFDTILNLITYTPIRGKLQDKIDSKMQEGE